MHAPSCGSRLPSDQAPLCWGKHQLQGAFPISHIPTKRRRRRLEAKQRAGSPSSYKLASATGVRLGQRQQAPVKELVFVVADATSPTVWLLGRNILHRCVCLAPGGSLPQCVPGDCLKEVFPGVCRCLAPGDSLPRLAPAGARQRPVGRSAPAAAPRADLAATRSHHRKRSSDGANVTRTRTSLPRTAHARSPSSRHVPSPDGTGCSYARLPIGSERCEGGVAVKSENNGSEGRGAPPTRHRRSNSLCFRAAARDGVAVKELERRGRGETGAVVGESGKGLKAQL
ncbi:hypothetical protein NDU88_006775 [Pleurodeles waltl]|uniref:Uncharacterized protein n=1 Tax=Pleurodeles waltl TaxID=8319 RepID=A0AAV7MFY3_PLEWA|nr:hypothetical protein NDU88_006775 [Pleurodeles waltl]